MDMSAENIYSCEQICISLGEQDKSCLHEVISLSGDHRQKKIGIVFSRSEFAPSGESLRKDTVFSLRHFGSCQTSCELVVEHSHGFGSITEEHLCFCFESEIVSRSVAHLVGSFPAEEFHIFPELTGIYGDIVFSTLHIHSPERIAVLPASFCKFREKLLCLFRSDLREILDILNYPFERIHEIILVVQVWVLIVESHILREHNNGRIVVITEYRLLNEQESEPQCELVVFFCVGLCDALPQISESFAASWHHAKLVFVEHISPPKQMIYIIIALFFSNFNILNEIF